MLTRFERELHVRLVGDDRARRAFVWDLIQGDVACGASLSVVTGGNVADVQLRHCAGDGGSAQQCQWHTLYLLDELRELSLPVIRVLEGGRKDRVSVVIERGCEKELAALDEEKRMLLLGSVGTVVRL